MPYVETNGVPYYYEMTGHGKPLLLLHGFSGSADEWRNLGALWGRRRLLVAVDLLGHARTACPERATRYAMPHAAADLLAIMEHLRLVPFDLLGYSMGGRLALFVGARHPRHVRRLVLESASPGLETAAEREARQTEDLILAEQIVAGGVESFVDRWQALPLFASQATLPPSVRSRVRRQRLSHAPIGLANSLRGMGTGAQPSLWPDLPDLAMPTLLLAGELDQKFMAVNRRMAVRLPQARFEAIGGAGHNIHLEKLEPFAEAVDPFLEDA